MSNNAFSITRSDDTLTVSGKEAGLGDEAQIHVVLSATALCINPGGNHPKAANKESVSAEGDFPVQNGKADFTLSATASFQPGVQPPDDRRLHGCNGDGHDERPDQELPRHVLTGLGLYGTRGGAEPPLVSAMRSSGRPD